MLLLAATPAPSLPAAQAAEYWLEYCSLLRACGLTAPAGHCTDALARGVPGVTYDETRCREPRTLAARGVSLGGTTGTRLFRFLGRRYRVVYPLEGQLALSAARLSFLLEDLPLAARLLAHYQKEPYAAESFPDGRVRASRGEGLTGEGQIISGSAAERTLYYFGSGVSHLGPWKLRGQALLEVQYWPAGSGLGYRVRIVSAPANAFLNTVMNLGLFKSVLKKRVREVLDDIGEASAKLQKDGGKSLAAAGLSPAERTKIEALLKLP